MKKGYVRTVLLFVFLPLIFALWVGPVPRSAAESGPVSSGPQAGFAPTPAQQAPPGPTVVLRAVSGASVLFRTQNGRTIDDVPPRTLDVPRLVLYRNGALTSPDERTLIVEVIGVEVPPPGVTITLRVETQHGDPDLGGDPSTRISVWRESQWINNTSDLTQTGVTAVFTHQFGGTPISGMERFATPTDYFRYDITVIDANHPSADPLHVLNGDYAFLMENQWMARLPEVQEASDGAAPDELVVYYCDMFPFQKSIDDPTTRLLRKDIPKYVHTELVPQMIEAFRVQTNDWGFPWYDAWTSFHPGEELERLSVALAEGQTWFHGRAPSRGNSGISIQVKGGGNVRYDTLTDGQMSAFHHELFHSLQRNINLNNGGNGDVGGEENAWQFFSEGTAVLASSVGQPGVQFAPDFRARAYMSYANHFLIDGGVLGDLNTSYERMDPYWAAIYWRFLYEQCGGMAGGVEDPAAGMQVINRALRVLYSGDVVDITSSTALVENVPAILDRTLEGSSCPFQTYEESLIAFARAISMLRLDGGRCTAPGTPAGCGFYDPNDLYYDFPVSTITYDGEEQQYAGEIGSSFGMDFVDVVLDPPSDGQPLTLEFYGAPGADAEFNVQVWELMDPGGGSRPQPVSTKVAGPKILTTTNPGRKLLYLIPDIDTTECNRLGLVITRTDARESSDPAGAYTIVLRPFTLPTQPAAPPP